VPAKPAVAGAGAAALSKPGRIDDDEDDDDDDEEDDF
jgi:hypothetical protein